MRYALIDESGRLYDPRDRILVISVVATPTLVGIDKIITKTRKRVPARGKRRRERLSEIKFSFCGDKTRRFVLGELVQKDIKIYSIVIDKQGRKIIERYHYVRGDRHFVDIIREKVVEEKFFTWKQIKNYSQQKSGIT